MKDNIKNQVKYFLNRKNELTREELENKFKITLNNNEREILKYGFIEGFDVCLDLFKDVIKEQTDET